MKNLTALSLLLIGAAVATNGYAQSSNTYIWNAGTGNWSNASNWAGGVVPNSTAADVFVDGGNTAVKSVVDMDNTFTVDQLTIDAGDTVVVENNNGLIMDAGSVSATTAFDNAGTLTLGSVGNYTDLSIRSIVTLMGGGVVNVTSASRILGGGTLINVDNTIQGDTANSNLGFDQLTLVNQAAGVIDANSASGAALTIDPDAGGLTNAGTLRASNGGVLTLSGYDVGSFANTSTGVIEALDGSQVQLVNGVTITGGVLSTTGTGIIHDSNGATLTNVTLQGALALDNSNALTLNGTITNNGVISVNSVGNYTDIDITGTTTLMGGGVVNVTSASRILGGGTLINVDNTIQGDTANSNLGFDQLTLVNQAAGVIDANSASGAALTIDPDAGGLTNAGTLRASNGGVLTLSGYDVGSFANTSTGVIEALDGSQVQLVNGVTITGGVLSTTGTGIIHDSNGATLTNVTLQGALALDNSNALTLNGTITNNGVISVNSVGNYTDIDITGNTTLAGTGVIDVTSATRILGGGTLNIGAGQTIQGDTAGSNLGFDQLTINNAGVINANSASGAALTIDPNGGGLTNTGTLMASNGGTLALSAYNVGTTNNTGTIAAEAGSTVSIDQNGLANLSNGVLTGGTYQVTSGTTGGAATLVLDGTNIPASVTNAATVVLNGPNSNLPAFQNLADNQGSFALMALRQFVTAGNLSNEGTISLDAGSTLNVAGNFTASGATGSTGAVSKGHGPHAEDATANSTLHIVVGGSASSGVQSPGMLQVSGLASLAGVLEVVLADAEAVPLASDTLTVVSAGSITGSFSNVTVASRLATADGAGSFVVSQESSGTGGAKHITLGQFAKTGQTIVPVVTVAVLGDGEAVEGGENGKVSIQRVGDTTSALTVLYKVAGSAKSGVDYKPVTGSVTIPAGTASAKVKIKPINNNMVDGTRVAKVKLLAPTDNSYTLGSLIVAKVKIIDND